MIRKEIRIECSFIEQEYYRGIGIDNYKSSFLQEQTWEAKGRILMSSKSDDITVLDTNNDIGWFPYPACLQCVNASGWFHEKSRILSYKVLILFGIYAFRLQKRIKGDGIHLDSWYRRSTYCRMVRDGR